MQHRTAQENTALAGNKARILEIRRKRRLRQLRATAICVLLVAAVLAYFLGAFGAPMALMGDLVDSAKIALTPGTGFPVALSLTGYTSAEPLAGGFVAVGNREVVLYSASGNLLRRIPHGYARPCITSGRNRVCIYSRGGKELSVESRTRHLYSQTFEEPVTIAEMSSNGTLAVFTKTQLQVYSPLFQAIWTWRDVSETPLGMAFGTDNKKLAVACLAADGGGIGTTLHFFNIRTDQEGPTVTEMGGIPVRMKYISSRKLLVVYDTCVVIYDVSTGTETARYAYGARQLQSVSIDGGNRIALLFGASGYPSVTSCVTLDASLTETGSAAVGRKAQSIVLSGRKVYVLAEKAVLCYELNGTLLELREMTTQPLSILDAHDTLLVTGESVSIYGAAATVQQTQQDSTPTEESAAESEVSSQTDVPAA